MRLLEGGCCWHLHALGLVVDNRPLAPILHFGQLPLPEPDHDVVAVDQVQERALGMDGDDGDDDDDDEDRASERVTDERVSGSLSSE